VLSIVVVYPQEIEQMKNVKKLAINKETLRTLSRGELANVGGAQDSGAGSGKAGENVVVSGTGYPTFITPITSILGGGGGDGGGGGGDGGGGC
jgi:hypothetical protein